MLICLVTVAGLFMLQFESVPACGLSVPVRISIMMKNERPSLAVAEDLFRRIKVDNNDVEIICFAYK